jgi:hypothetical protein
VIEPVVLSKAELPSERRLRLVDKRLWHLLSCARKESWRARVKERVEKRGNRESKR